MTGDTTQADRRQLSDLDERLRAVVRITQLFRAERFVYLSFAIIAFAMLLICLILNLTGERESTTASLGAFGSSGVVAFTSSRVLLMWSKAIAIVAAAKADVTGGQS